MEDKSICATLSYLLTKTESCNCRYNKVSLKRKLAGFIVGPNDKQSRFRQLICGVRLHQACI